MKSSAQGAEPRDEQLGFVPWNWHLPSPVCTGFGAFLSVTLWIVLLRDKLGSWCPPGCPLTQLLVSNNGGREVTQLSKPAPSVRFCHHSGWVPQSRGNAGDSTAGARGCPQQGAPGTVLVPELSLGAQEDPHIPAPTQSHLQLPL